MSNSEDQKTFFNLNDESLGIHRQLAEGIATRIFPGEQAMISVVTIDANVKGTLHKHPEEQWGVCLEGSLTRIQDGVETAVVVGDFWRTPPNVMHTVIGGPEGAKVLDIFAPPRDAYLKPGSGFAS